jgi:hypothetical protein
MGLLINPITIPKIQTLALLVPQIPVTGTFALFVMNMVSRQDRILNLLHFQGGALTWKNAFCRLLKCAWKHLSFLVETLVMKK